MQIKIQIHRGSHEVGGNCVEISTERTRLILEVGMPLKADVKMNTREEAKPYFLDVPGLFSKGIPIDAILLSHAHGDHFGLISHTQPEIPVYMTKGTSKMLTASSLFGTQKTPNRNRTKSVDMGKTIQIGDFKVTFCPVDHSIYDAAAIMIESNGKRILYSGDVRMHGNKPRMMRNLVQIGKGVNVLIMEGTHMGSERHRGKSEEYLMLEVAGQMKETDGMALLMFSPTNLDRIVTFIKACNKVRRTLVLDPYTVWVMNAVRAKGENTGVNLPDPYSKDFSILPAEWCLSQMRMNILRNSLDKFQGGQVSLNDLKQNPSKYAVVFRERLLDTEFAGMIPHGSNVFYSYWSGYLEEPRMNKLLSTFKERGIGLIKANCGGHIFKDDIVKLIKQIKPQCVMPIHTEHRDAFAKQINGENTQTIIDSVTFVL